MNKKFKWLKAVLFIALAVCLITAICSPFSYPRSYVSEDIAAYFDEDKNTVDGLLVGTSVLAYSWQPTVAYERNGQTIYQAGTSIQAFGVLPEYIDALTSAQDIKYLIIDIHGLRSAAVKTSVKPDNLRRLYNDLPLTNGRYSVLNASLEYARRVYGFYGQPEKEVDIIDFDDISWYVPFYSFHNRWKDGLEKKDFDLAPNPYKGALEHEKAFKTYDNTENLEYWDDAQSYSLNAFQIDELDRLFDYLKEKGIPTMFICTPSFNSEEEEAELRSIMSYIAQKGYDTIDFGSREMLDKPDIHTAADFCNSGHLNSRGGHKFTEYMSDYLRDNGYYYADHRGDSAYSSWDDAAQAYNSYYNKNWEKADEQAKEDKD